MVVWSDPKEIARDSDAFIKILYSLFGLFVWEIFTTFEFEWSFITGRRKARWPLVFFFLCRYCMFFAFIGLLVSVTSTSKVDCNALFTFNSWTGNMAILCASTSLMIRTIALWERKVSIMIPLLVLCTGHWGLLYRGMFIVKAAWEPTYKTCVVVQTNPALLKVNFFYTMGFDLIILVFTSVALFKKHSQRTGLWTLLFTDGLVYFLISFSMNSIPAILNVLNLNQIMNVIGTVPAACISAIAACRSTIRLQEFARADVYVHSATNIAPNSATPRQTASTYNAKAPRYGLTRPEVHVTTEHITMAEFGDSSAEAVRLSKEQERKLSLDGDSEKDLEAFEKERISPFNHGY